MTKYYVLWLLIVLFVVSLGILIIPKERKTKVSNLYYEDELEEQADLQLKAKELSYWEKQREFVKQSRIGMSFEMYIMFHVLTVSIAIALGYFIFRNPIMAFMIGGLGFLFPKQYVKSKRLTVIQNFDKQLVDVLDRLSSMLRNNSIQSAFEVIASSDDVYYLIREEFLEMIVDLRSSRPIEEAIYNSYKRIGSDALHLMYIQIKLDRELGLTLPELFQSIRHSIIKNIHTLEDAKIVTAQATMQARGISWFVFIIIGLLFFLAPDQYSVLLDNTIGRVVFFSLIGIMITGLTIINNIVKS